MTGHVLDQLLAAPGDHVSLGAQALPPRHRPWARRRVLDVTEYFGHASGGVRTYLLAKAEWIAQQADLAHALVIPGERDAVVPYHGTHVYRLRGPAIPFHASYRVLLATRSLRRIIAHERPDLIEVGSSYFAPWMPPSRRASSRPAISPRGASSASCA